MKHLGFAVAFLCALIATDSYAQDKPWPDAGAPCSAFGAISGTCVQGQDARLPTGAWPTTTVNGDFLSFNGTTGAPQDSTYGPASFVTPTTIDNGTLPISVTTAALGGNVTLSGPTSNIFECGRAAAQASPNSCKFQIGESGSGTNIAAGNGEIDLGVGTGTGALPTFILKAPTALQGSGSTAQTLSTILDFNATNSGSWTFNSSVPQQNVIYLKASDRSSQFGLFTGGDLGVFNSTYGLFVVSNVSGPPSYADLRILNNNETKNFFELQTNSSGDNIFAAYNSSSATIGTTAMEIRANADLQTGNGTAISTSATGGFFALETMNGAPTGTPTNAAAGLSQCVVNYASENLNCYVNGAWYHVALTSGAN